MLKKPEDAPWFKLYVTNWLLSERMATITWEMKGIFIDLLALQWNLGGSLPSSHLVLQKLIFCDEEAWERSGRPIIEIFFVAGDDGRIRNPKLYDVWLDMGERHKKNVEKGRKGGIATAQLKPKSSPAKARLKPKSSTAGEQLQLGSSIKEVEVEVEVEVEKEDSSTTAPPSAEKALESLQREIFAYFKEKTGKVLKHYTLGAKRFAAMMAISTVIASRAPKNEQPEVYVKRVWKHVIDKLAASDWHMGRDPKTNGKTFNDLMLIATDLETFEKWLN